MSGTASFTGPPRDFGLLRLSTKFTLTRIPIERIGIRSVSCALAHVLSGKPVSTLALARACFYGTCARPNCSRENGPMLFRGVTGALAALGLCMTPALAFDDALYPDLSG